MSIYLNTVVGSRELEGCAIDKAITAMAMRLAKLPNALKNNGGASIDLTLMLPGNSQKPDFEGMRMTRFSSSDAVLYMESAVPEQMLHSEQADRYVSALLQDAIENAAEFFAEQGVQFFSKQWQGVLDS